MDEYSAKLPREKARTVGAAYARYSTQHQDSIADQIRVILEDAANKGIHIPRQNIFFDLAVRGCQSHRPGLDGLRQVLDSKKVQVVLFFATNRLFRKVHKALEFVDRVVKEQGIRCVFVKSGIDSADTKRWELLLQVNGLMDQFASSMYADHIRAAQEGLLAKQHVFGTVTFGYAGQPIEGERTRRNLPRHKLVIDPVAAGWVKTIFRWYVEDRLAVDEIIRRLNDVTDIPLPPRCLTERWTRQAVMTVLRNGRYRGFWTYGATESVWLGSKDYSRQLKRERPLKEVQFEELRIIDDRLWFAAESRLLSEKAKVGRKSKDGNRESRPRLLDGLFWCPTHDHPLYVGGSNGRALFCPCCRALPASKRPLFTLLNRQLALRLTCEKVRSLLVEDSSLIAECAAVCRREAMKVQQTDDTQLARLRNEVEQVTRSIEFILTNVGERPQDQEEARRILQDMRESRAMKTNELRRAELAANQPVRVPTDEELKKMIHSLDQILTQAVHGNDEGKARQIIDMLTGGRIDLVQQGEAKAKRGWLQGRFRARIVRSVLAHVGTTPPKDDGIDVTIDFKPVSPLADEMMQAKALWDEGLTQKQIAARLKCGPNKVSRLLRQWHEEQGIPMPNGRPHWNVNAETPPLYQSLADSAKALWDAGQSDLQIARSLDCSAPTAVAAVNYWHQLRGEKMPDHDQRRQAKVDRMVLRYDEGAPILQLAAEFLLSTRSVTLLLRQRLKQLGREMKDGRTRRAETQTSNAAGDPSA